MAQYAGFSLHAGPGVDSARGARAVRARVAHHGAAQEEIGIRKVLGGTVADIIALLAGELGRLALLANVVAWQARSDEAGDRARYVLAARRTSQPLWSWRPPSAGDLIQPTGTL